MEEEYAVPPGASENPTAFRQLLGYFGGPSFLRRQRRMDVTLQCLLQPLAAKRKEMLEIVRLRIGQLFALAGMGTLLDELLSEGDRTSLRTLHDELAPVLRIPLEATSHRRTVRSALLELIEAMEWFNAFWKRVMAEADLTEVNAAREAYNRLYVFEKECATGSPLAARRGFVPAEMFTMEELWRAFPLLKVPTSSETIAR